MVKGSRERAGNELGFKVHLWKMADVLRNDMDTAEDRHVVLGLIFPKSSSDAFGAKYAELAAQRQQGADSRSIAT